MGEEKLQIENFKNIFEFFKKIEILMIRNFWMKKNAKKFNKCETKCDRNVTKITKRFVIKLKICSILRFYSFLLVRAYKHLKNQEFVCWKVLV